MPQELVEDPILYGEYLSGALYWNDYQTIVAEAGFKNARVVDHRRLALLRSGRLRRYALWSVPRLRGA